MACDTFSVGDLTAVIGDNGAHGDHRAGYNGVFSLTSRHEDETLFVPAYSGLNLEHVFDGAAFDRDLIFEPRVAPMSFERVDATTARLHQPPTPHFALESTTTFTLRAPHYIDMTFECVAHEDVYAHGYIGLFWASYMNAPLDKSIYFLSRDRWAQFCTQRHNDESTVLPNLDGEAMPAFVGDHPEMLYSNASPFRFDQPFYYGRFRRMAYVLMFDRMEGVRFSHSPSGGGDSPETRSTSPAWDFQYIIPEYTVGASYGFRARVAYKPFDGREDVLREVRKWRAELNGSG
jgi:hypothetical protein